MKLIKNLYYSTQIKFWDKMLRKEGSRLNEKLLDPRGHPRTSAPHVWRDFEREYTRRRMMKLYYMRKKSYLY